MNIFNADNDIMKKSILLSLFIYAFTSPAFAQNNIAAGPGAPGAPQKALLKTIIVDNYYPYTFVNKSGKPDGFSVDLIKEIASIIDYDLEIVPGKWEDARNALKAGTIDLLPMMAYSVERDRDFDFTIPHTISYDAFFVRKNTNEIKSLSDLAGKKIIVMKNDQAYDYLLSSGHVSAGQLIMIDSLPDALRLLSSGTGDTAFMPKLVGLLHMKNLKLDNIDDSPHVIYDYNRPFSIAVREGNKELLDKLKEGLRIVHATGKYNKLYEKWFGILNTQGISFKIIITYTLIGVLFFICAGALLLFWSFSLKRQIEAHTGFLKKEIDQRIQTENVLARLNERFSLATRAAQLGIWDWDIKKDILEWDDRMYELYGLRRDNSRGVYDTWLAGIHPNDCAKASEAIQQAMSGEKEYEIDFRVLWPNGTVRNIRAYGMIVRDDTGAPVRMTGINYDITNLSLAVEALQTSEEKFSKVFFYSPLLMTISELDNGSYVDVNDVFCRISGFSRDECIGKKSAQLGWISAEDRIQLIEILRATGDVSNHELTLTRKNGTKIVCLYFGEIITIQGKPHLLSIAQDITERKIIEDTQMFLLQCSLPTNKEDFFESLARFLSGILNVEYVCIDRLEGDSLTARTVAIFNSGHFEDNVSYTLKDTPCGEVVGKRICYFPRNVSGLFPVDAVLQQLKAESYIGTTLWSSDGRAIGLIAAIGKRPLVDTKIGETVLNLVSLRAAGELERREAQEALHSSEEKFRFISENIPLGMFFQINSGIDGTRHEFTYISPAVEILHGLTADDVMREPGLLYGQIDENDRSLLIDREAEAFASKSMLDIDVKVRMPSGEACWRRFMASPYTLPDGRVLWNGIEIDITDRRKAEESLREKLHELERFASLTADRELRMIELKKEINELLRKYGEKEKYRIAE